MLTVIAQQIRQHVPGIIQLGTLHCIIESFLIISQVHVADCSVQVCFGIVWIVFYILIALPATHNSDTKLPGPVVKHSCYQGSPAYYIAFAFARELRSLDLLLRRSHDVVQ